MTPQELKNSILQLAIQGKLVEQRPEEGTAAELLEKILAAKGNLTRSRRGAEDMSGGSRSRATGSRAACRASSVPDVSVVPFVPSVLDDEKPFDIPENWEWVRLGDVINIVSARRVHQSDWKKEGIPFYRAREIAKLATDGYVDNDLYISQELYDEFAKSGVPHEGDLMVTAVGTLGKTYIVKSSDCFYYKDASVICFENYAHLSPQYLKYLMESELMKSQIKSNSSGTTVATLTMVRAKEYLIPLPPIAEQKRIVAKIEELLPLIDRYEKARSKLEDFNKRFPVDMQKSVLQMAIQGKLVDQRPEEGTGEELYRQIQAEKQRLVKSGKIKKEKPLPEITEGEKNFDIPECWTWVRVGDVCTNIQYGSSKKSAPTGTVPVLRMGNIQNGRIDYNKLVFTSDEEEIQKYSLEVDDLLFNRTNSKELVGKVALYKGERPAIYAGYLVRLTPVKIYADYLNYVMQSQYYWGYCQSVRSDAIGQSNINAEKLKRFVVPLPPLAEQKRIVAKLEEILPLCERLK